MFQWVQDTSYAAWVRESWGWPLALTAHAFGNGIVAGLMLIIALRVLGLFRTIPFATIQRLFPIIWFGVLLQVVSGTTLWATKPDKYLAAGMFEAKLTSVLIGCILTRYFQVMLRREAAAWDAAGKASAGGVRIMSSAAVIWICVITFGRLTAYLGTLYS